MSQPPEGSLDQAAEWLLGRHPDLRAALGCLPRVQAVRGSGQSIDLNAVAASLLEFDDYAMAWARYAREHPEPPPEPEHIHESWFDAGPASTPTVDAWMSMSTEQLGQAQLVAALSGARIPFRLGVLLEDPDFGSLSVLRDWLRAVEAVRSRTDEDESRRLDDDLAKGNEPGWIRLDLDDKTVEVVAHLAHKPEATTAERARELFPGEDVIRAAANFQAACERMNQTASAATGKPGPAIEIPGVDEDPQQPRPEIRLRLMTSEPYIEAR